MVVRLAIVWAKTPLERRFRAQGYAGNEELNIERSYLRARSAEVSGIRCGSSYKLKYRLAGTRRYNQDAAGEYLKKI